MGTSRSGVIGSRADFKSQCPNGRVGSNPTFGTMINPWPGKAIRAVYGPYRRKYKRSPDRYQITVKFEDGSSSSMSYARWVMTQHLGRVLESWEHVDHKNENTLDDRIENLQILTPGDNNRKSNLGKSSPLKGIEKGWSHGTVYGWMKKKCDCAECVSAKREWHDQRNAARRKPNGYGERKN